MLRTLELKPSRQKSYWGRAYVEETDDSYTLLSYGRPVIRINKSQDWYVYKLWNSYSRTTMLHINDFLMQHNKRKMCKKLWCAIRPNLPLMW